MRYLVTKEIKSETQVFWKLYFRDFVFLILWIGISRFLESAVHTYLQIPFLIFSIVMGVILVLPSSQNPKRRQYQSIALYLMQTKKTYYLLPKKNLEVSCYSHKTSRFLNIYEIYYVILNSLS